MIYLHVVICTVSVLSFRKKNRQNKAESPELHSLPSYMVFDNSKKLSDNHLYSTCQTVEEVELHFTSKQNQKTGSPQQTALNSMHRIDQDYDLHRITSL